MSPTPFNITRYSLLYFTSTDPTVANDACTALPSSTPSLASRVVVVRRGGCDFAVKLNVLAKAGACVPSSSSLRRSAPAADAVPLPNVNSKVVLIYNSPNTLTLPQFNVGTTGLEAVGGLRYEDGVRVRPSAHPSRRAEQLVDVVVHARSSSTSLRRRRGDNSSRFPSARSSRASSTASPAALPRAHPLALSFECSDADALRSVQVLLVVRPDQRPDPVPLDRCAGYQHPLDGRRWPRHHARHEPV